MIATPVNIPGAATSMVMDVDAAIEQYRTAELSLAGVMRRCLLPAALPQAATAVDLEHAVARRDAAWQHLLDRLGEHELPYGWVDPQGHACLVQPEARSGRWVIAFQRSNGGDKDLYWELLSL